MPSFFLTSTIGAPPKTSKPFQQPGRGAKWHQLQMEGSQQGKWRRLSRRFKLPQPPDRGIVGIGKS